MTLKTLWEAQEDFYGLPYIILVIHDLIECRCVGVLRQTYLNHGNDIALAREAPVPKCAQDHAGVVDVVNYKLMDFTST